VGLWAHEPAATTVERYRRPRDGEEMPPSARSRVHGMMLATRLTRSPLVKASFPGVRIIRGRATGHPAMLPPWQTKPKTVPA